MIFDWASAPGIVQMGVMIYSGDPEDDSAAEQAPPSEPTEAAGGPVVAVGYMMNR